MDIMNEDNIIMNSNTDGDDDADVLMHADDLFRHDVVNDADGVKHGDGVVYKDVDIIHTDVPNPAYDRVRYNSAKSQFRHV